MALPTLPDKVNFTAFIEQTKLFDEETDNKKERQLYPVFMGGLKGSKEKSGKWKIASKRPTGII